MHQSYHEGEQRQFYKEDPFASTTYGAYFKGGNDKPRESAASNFNSAKAPAKDEEGIHWAGGLHNRGDFNKRKDPIVNWTEVLFRNWNC